MKIKLLLFLITFSYGLYLKNDITFISNAPDNSILISDKENVYLIKNKEKIIRNVGDFVSYSHDKKNMFFGYKNGEIREYDLNGDLIKKVKDINKSIDFLWFGYYAFFQGGVVSYYPDLELDTIKYKKFNPNVINKSRGYTILKDNNVYKAYDMGKLYGKLKINYPISKIETAPYWYVLDDTKKHLAVYDINNSKLLYKIDFKTKIQDFYPMSDEIRVAYDRKIEIYYNGKKAKIITFDTSTPKHIWVNKNEFGFLMDFYCIYDKKNLELKTISIFPYLYPYKDYYVSIYSKYFITKKNHYHNKQILYDKKADKNFLEKIGNKLYFKVENRLYSFDLETKKVKFLFKANNIKKLIYSNYHFILIANKVYLFDNKFNLIQKFDIKTAKSAIIYKNILFIASNMMISLYKKVSIDVTIDNVNIKNSSYSLIHLLPLKKDETHFIIKNNKLFVSNGNILYQIYNKSDVPIGMPEFDKDNWEMKKITDVNGDVNIVAIKNWDKNHILIVLENGDFYVYNINTLKWDKRFFVNSKGEVLSEN